MRNLTKLVMTVGTVVVFYSTVLTAQDMQRNPAPGTTKPALTNNFAVKPAPLPAAKEQPLDPGLGVLKGIRILGSLQQFKGSGVGGFDYLQIEGPDFLRDHKLEVVDVVAKYLRRPLTRTALDNLQTDIIRLCRRLDRPVVDVYYPEQEIVDGRMQMIVYEGKVGKISVVNDGHKWFKDSFITNRVHLHSGESISQEQLIKDLSNLNRNPTYREVSARYKQGDLVDKDGNFDEQKLPSGTTDIDMIVKDRFPLRVFAGVDDYGLKVLGENRVFAGFGYGNVFGWDHQINYQYTADSSFSHFKSQSASYIAPLPFGQFSIYGGYNDINADLSKIGFGALQNKGKTYQASLRYTMPLPKFYGIEEDVAIGFDYKHADTAIEFGQVSLSPFRADVDQAVVEYRGYRRDRLGYSQLTLTAYYSPGGLLGRNTDTDFHSFNSNLKSSYYYGRATGERGFNLPWGMSAIGRGIYQESSGSLIPSEQFYLGGYQLLRGYPENVISGDQGYAASAELHSPIFKTGNITGQKNIPGQADGDGFELLAFIDYGSVKQKHPAAGQNSEVTLTSVGAGGSLHISQNLMVNFSYGYQLKALNANDGVPSALFKDKSRFHLSATFSY